MRAEAHHTLRTMSSLSEAMTPQERAQPFTTEPPSKTLAPKTDALSIHIPRRQKAQIVRYLFPNYFNYWLLTDEVQGNNWDTRIQPGGPGYHYSNNGKSQVHRTNFFSILNSSDRSWHLPCRLNFLTEKLDRSWYFKNADGSTYFDTGPNRGSTGIYTASDGRQYIRTNTSTSGGNGESHWWSQLRLLSK